MLVNNTLVVIVCLMLLAGVVYPAVWSRNPGRRRDALRLTRTILTALRRPKR
ncbi:hypothetical protein OG495_19745 [Streptomyces longwoodensis]|uniref:hypothetical protein n=1 Tax=Streptomyces longwoodensis TaxID=68231 RepID=UPI00386439BE